MLFFARDPGAADVLLPIFREFADSATFCAKDFARNTLRAAAIPFVDFNAAVYDGNLKPESRETIVGWLQGIPRPDLVITGTTHFDDFTDRLLWRECAEMQIPTIAVLDQWLRVDERFIAGGEVWRPSYVLTPHSEITRRIIEKQYSLLGAETIGNPHILSVLETANRYREGRQGAREQLRKRWGKKFSNLVIYASEPQRLLTKTGAQYKDVTYDEMTVFESLRRALKDSALDDPLLVVKLHPKEDPSGYAGIHPYVIQREVTKEVLLSAADIVVGTKSMLLIEGVLYGALVCSIDFWGLSGEQLITNECGLSYRVRSESELKTFLDQSPTKKRPTSDEVIEKLEIKMDWKKIVHAVVGQIGARASAE